MGQHFSSEPVVDKETERDQNDQFNVAVSSCQGWRMSQEDNHCLMLELPGEHKSAFFAVFDGHGSARVSKHASESLWRHLVDNDNYAKGDFRAALEQAFLTFDQEVKDSYNAQLAGTTAVCLLIVDTTIYCANIGDSRAVASVNCHCVPLSYDHKPENPQELRRILAAGGYVLGNRVNGNLALSRAFGDFHYKGNDQLPPEMQIVSPHPDLRTLELNDDLDFLIIACDGIWDVLSSEEAVEFVQGRLEHQMEPGLICEQLTTRCLASDYELVIGCDNMTVLLVCYTRGRSWEQYCNDLYLKNSKRVQDDIGGPWQATSNERESMVNPGPTQEPQRDEELTVTENRSDDTSNAADTCPVPQINPDLAKSVVPRNTTVSSKGVCDSKNQNEPNDNQATVESEAKGEEEQSAPQIIEETEDTPQDEELEDRLQAGSSIDDVSECGMRSDDPSITTQEDREIESEDLSCEKSDNQEVDKDTTDKEPQCEAPKEPPPSEETETNESSDKNECEATDDTN